MNVGQFGVEEQRFLLEPSYMVEKLIERWLAFCRTVLSFKTTLLTSASGVI